MQVWVIFHKKKGIVSGALCNQSTFNDFGLPGDF
jgi:hypothetical protein